MLRTLALTASLATAGLLLSLSLKSKTGAATVPVDAIVTAEARHGKQVPALQQGDVMAWEHRDRLQVTGLVPLEGENAGLQLFILVDDSSSWTAGSQLTDLRQFIGAQAAAVQIGIGYIRNGTVVVEQDFTTDHIRAERALRVPLEMAEASPYLSFSDLIKRWPAAPVRRAVVMVTSGIDPLGGFGPSDPYLDTAIEDAQRQQVIVYAIYAPAAGHSGHSPFRINWGQNHLAQLGDETGGEAYMLGFEPPVDFSAYLDEIAAHLTHQYRVTFLAPAATKPRFQDVRFSTEVPDAELVAASKVFVPAAK